MEHGFGARLRARREEQRVTLGAIARQTKIKESLLESLESDDVTNWPKGIFGRAYLRDYARAVSVDPETLVLEFLAHYPEFVTPEPAEDPPHGDLPSGLAARVRQLLGSFGRGPSAAGTPDPAPATEDFGVFAPASPVGEAHDRGVEPDVTVGAPSIADGSHRLPRHDRPTAAGSADQQRADAVRKRAMARITRRATSELNLEAAAELCSRLACAAAWHDVAHAIADAARLFDAIGVIVWAWDARAAALRPAVAHGYGAAVMSRLPNVATDADNAVAEAFRSNGVCFVEGEAGAADALVVPATGAHGCVGVLALELRPGGPPRDTIRAFASLLAAQLTPLLPADEPTLATGTA